MGALATNLAAAQFAAKSDRLNTRSATLQKQISTASSLKSMLSGFAASLGERVRTGDLSPQPSLANPAVASAALSGVRPPSGSYALEVNALASAQTLASPAYAMGASVVGGGTLILRFGTVADGTLTEDPAHAAVNIAVPAGATLAQAANAINAANAGVTAYVAQSADGARLVLKGQSGAANGFVVDAAEAPGESGLAALGWNAGGDPARLAKSSSDAAFTIDGVAMRSPGNLVREALPGVNLTLTATNIGAPTQLNFSDPSAAITSAMQDLTSALNEIASALGQATDPLTGDLANDSGAQALRRSLGQLAGTEIMTNAATGEPRTLADLGLSTQRDGSFALNPARLAATLQTSPQGAAAMFTAGLRGVFATVDSLVRRASAAGNPGSLAGSITRLSARASEVTANLTKIAEQQEALRARLATRFTAADINVGASKSTLSFLQNQIDAWNSKAN